MERSEDTNATITRIMKSMDRSNAILLRSIGYFQNPSLLVEEAPLALQPTASVVGPKAGRLSKCTRTVCEALARGRQHG